MDIGGERIDRLKGIKGRLIGSYIFIIAITVAILEIFLVATIGRYYYNNIEDMLSSQIKVSVDFYNSYLSSSNLRKNIQENADIFWKNTSAEVQIIDTSGEMLMDSIGNLIPGKVPGDDIEKALKGEMSTYIGKDINTKEKIMCISYPLKSSDKIEGVIRFVTSLSEVNKIIGKITIILVAIGLAVIIISSLVGIFLSNTIIKPLHELTGMARKIASGRFNERITKKRNDEIGQLSDTLNFMAEEILKNDKLKNEFVASISHELRTPLTSIKGWALTIRTGSLEDKNEIIDGLEIIEKESDRLSKLVEELLDFSKFVSGKITLQKDFININNTILHIQKQMVPRAQRQKVVLNICLEEKLPLILIDENRIKQVLINILDNAFNFTPEGGFINLDVQKSYKSLVITVKDSGIGINQEDLPKVTEKFFKGKNSKTGNGIGLSICKEIANLHNAQLIIDSQYGNGTTVQIILPVEE